MWNCKNKICKKSGKLIQPGALPQTPGYITRGEGVLNTVASTGADLLIQHGIPWLGKRSC